MYNNKYILFLFLVFVLVINVITSTAYISDIGMTIRKNDSKTELATILGFRGFKPGDMEIPISKKNSSFFQYGVIGLSSIQNIIPKNLKTIKVEMNFDKMKLFRIDAPNIVILQQSDHIAFGSSVIVELPINNFSKIKYIALRLAPGELYCLLIIILGIISLVITIIVFGFKKLMLMTTIFAIMGLVITFWMFLKFWQAF